jgi:hypothetical protein
LSALLSAVFSASVTAGVAWQLFHTRSRGKVGQAALGVMLLSVVISALTREVSLDFDIGEILPDDADEGEYYYVAEEALCLGVSRAVCSEFGFSESDVSVRLINFDFEALSADTVAVTLSGAAALGDYRAVSRFVEEMQIGRCSIDVQIG